MALDEIQVKEMLGQIAELKYLYQKQLNEYVAMRQTYERYLDRLAENKELVANLERRQTAIDNGRLLAGDKRKSVHELFPEDESKPRVVVSKGTGEVYRQP